MLCLAMREKKKALQNSNHNLNGGAESKDAQKQI